MTSDAIGGVAEHSHVRVCARSEDESRSSLLACVAVAVSLVPDPELAGVAIGSLGLVRSVTVNAEGVATVVLVATFLGCPALEMMRADVAVAALGAGASRADVTFATSPPWTTAAITVEGRASLASLGIAVAIGGELACPFCGSRSVLRSLSEVGPASCRSVKWCDSCRNVVEVMRDPEPAVVMTLPRPIRRPSRAHV